ncbi:MAG: hypothetical protein H6Q73_4218 [Firmicutes bacterium]|nr:hypothetical protein [Bacillota bacterium]
MCMKSKSKLNKPVDAMELVSVRRNWNSWEIAQVYVGDVSNPLWDLESGGVKESSPEALIFGYIWCDMIVSGSVAHSCLHGTAPHSIKICILRKDNSPRIYNYFLTLIGPKPALWQR